MMVVDYTMPGFSGFELFTQARALRPGLPVVLVTGGGTSPIGAEANRLGFGPILLKPCTSAELAGAVETVLGGLGRETR